MNVVTDHSADRTGRTVSTTAFQAALDAVAVAGDNTVTVPPGAYLIDQYLQIKPGYTSLTITMYGATIKRADGAGALTLFKNYTGSTNYPVNSGPSDITIKGGTLDLNCMDNQAGSQGISIAHSSNLLIEDVTILNCPAGHAIEINSTDGAMVRNCTFRGRTIDTNSENEAVQIDGAYSSGTIGSQPWDNTPCNDITVTGCTMSGINGLSAWGALAGSHTAREDYPHTNIHVDYNTIFDAQHYGVKALNWRGGSITNNYFKGCNGGVSAIIGTNNTAAPGTLLTQNLDISDNVFVDMGNTPNTQVGPMSEVIKLVGQVAPYSHIGDITCQDNIIDGYVNPYGIYVANGERMTVTGNRIIRPSYTLQTPITVKDTATATLTGNKATAGHSNHIVVSGSTGVTNSGNTTSVVATESETMPVITGAEDATDRSVTVTSYGDVSPLSASIVVQASRKVLISWQVQQSVTSGNTCFTGIEISKGGSAVLSPDDDRSLQSTGTSAVTMSGQYLADFATLGGGSVVEGDTVTVKLKHRVSAGTGTITYRNVALVTSG